MKTRSWWGWGWEEEALTTDQTEKLAAAIASRFDRTELPVRAPADLSSIDLPAPRVEPPAAWASLFTDDRRERARRTYGRSYRDVVRGFRGELTHPPDLVAMPSTDAEVVGVLDWASDAGVAVIPYGGGSSVVGGVECDVGDSYRAAVSLDLTAMDQVLEIDEVSRAARIQAGVLGPALEDQLRPHGYTLRHFPQSFEFSTLGGWLATRSGGHYATVYTHIDDMVESMRVVTPAGISESRRLPGSGAGPSPDRMFLGSEGSLGVITEAWMRIQDRPRWKASAGIRFADFTTAAAAVRDISQSGLFPANCRLLDAGEALISAAVDDGSALLVLGFESADHPVDAAMARGAEIARAHGGNIADGIKVTTPDDEAAAGREGAVGAWRNAFIRAPYGRDAMVAMSVIAETFETACTWDRFPELHAEVTAAVEKALADVCGGGWVTCRFTHVYPDGPAPYFTVLAPGRPGDEITMWADIKAAASETLLACGATITHHHAVGRDHRPWYDRQRPELFATALRAAKATLDPAGILNPGAVIDPQERR
jgi:alkyldihydroxyacetonephosphate synthase